MKREKKRRGACSGSLCRPYGGEPRKPVQRRRWSSYLGVERFPPHQRYEYSYVYGTVGKHPTLHVRPSPNIEAAGSIDMYGSSSSRSRRTVLEYSTLEAEAEAAGPGRRAFSHPICWDMVDLESTSVSVGFRGSAGLNDHIDGIFSSCHLPVSSRGRASGTMFIASEGGEKKRGFFFIPECGWSTRREMDGAMNFQKEILYFSDCKKEEFQNKNHSSPSSSSVECISMKILFHSCNPPSTRTGGGAGQCEDGMRA